MYKNIPYIIQNILKIKYPDGRALNSFITVRCLLSLFIIIVLECTLRPFLMIKARKKYIIFLNCYRKAAEKWYLPVLYTLRGSYSHCRNFIIITTAVDDYSTVLNFNNERPRSRNLHKPSKNFNPDADLKHILCIKCDEKGLVKV